MKISDHGTFTTNSSQQDKPSSDKKSSSMPNKYEPSSFESKWQKKWSESNLFQTKEDSSNEKYYALDFFPYPSGTGLSVGHCRNYIPTDVLCRMKVMQGYNVLHPMGFDAFGLPAENEAIAKKTHPAAMIKKYADTYKRQLDLVGISFDWSRCFSSCDPSYYKWTQWIFKILYKKGLAYRKMSFVNWDPVEQTVLANEEVVGGRGWRSGAIVERKQIPQWYFKITAYGERLIEGLEKLNWPEGIKQMQRNWIGRREGIKFRMPLTMDTDPKVYIEVFTTRIDTLYGMTFCILAPESQVVETLIRLADETHANGMIEYREKASHESEQDRLADNREKTGVFTGFYVTHPITRAKIPLWLSDYVIADYGAGAVFAVPAHDERDFQFATKFKLPIKQVIEPHGSDEVSLPYTSKEGKMINSGPLDGLSVPEAQEKLSDWVQNHNIGEKSIQYKFRDWLISRQRYWGCPIPVMYDEDGNTHLVDDEDLPVELPHVESYQPSGDGSSPLSRVEEFVKVEKNGKTYTRETDTMGGFACSSWYFLRFADPHNYKQAWDIDKINSWLPVDTYVGGAEHAVMHLLYARFWTKVLHDEGLLNFDEPFQTLHNQGMVLAQTPYRHPNENEKLSISEDGIQLTFAEASELDPKDVFYKWEKMSKSKGNVVTPDEAVEKYGADALRIFELFVAPFEQNLQWSEEGIQGSVRFLNRIFKYISEHQDHYIINWKNLIDQINSSDVGNNIRRITHKSIKKCTEDIERFAFNTYISTLMVFMNELQDITKNIQPDQWDRNMQIVLSEAIETFILLLSPAAPHTSDEIWSKFGHTGFCYHKSWPIYSAALTKDSTITIAIQINGKLRATEDVDASLSQEEIMTKLKSNPKIQSYLNGKQIVKEIYIPSKLINIVVR